MKLFLEKSFIRIFTPVFISLFILIVGVSAYVYFQQRNRILTNASGYYSDLLRQRSELLHAKFAPTISDLGFFAHQLLVIKYLDNSTGKPELIKEMQLFAQFNRSYQQIRFINAKGMEQIRINWVGDSLIITPDKLLQDKSQRYYFKKTAALHPGEIYVSPIDLNMEHGKIEIPYQRVIRFGTPIFNKDNQFAGVIIINQNLNTLFNRLKITNDHYNGHLMFLNRDGYWLFGSKENKSFGFMFDSLKNQRLSNLFPKRWNKITKQSSGEIYGPKGMDIFQHVGLGYHAGRGDNFYPGKVYVDAVNDWVLLVHVDYANIKNYKSNKTVFLLVLGVSIFLVLYIAYIMSRLRFKEKKYVAEINAVNKSLEYKIEQRTKEL
ncbi:MAG TPA: cache domain-containing protein, partial [Sunxiuqinia sp.]|nr:cache domain-containing protein [Sunxiuqinia sp.]